MGESIRKKSNSFSPLATSDDTPMISLLYAIHDKKKNEMGNYKNNTKQNTTFSSFHIPLARLFLRLFGGRGRTGGRLGGLSGGSLLLELLELSLKLSDALLF